MAGSYNHAVTENGKLLNRKSMAEIATENQGDAYETIEEMYRMIWYLAQGDKIKVEMARKYYRIRIDFSPGVEV